MLGLNVFKVYITIQEFNDFVRGRLSDENKAKFEEYSFVPIKIGLNECDLSIECIFTPTPTVVYDD